MALSTHWSRWAEVDRVDVYAGHIPEGLAVPQKSFFRTSTLHCPLPQHTRIHSLSLCPNQSLFWHTVTGWILVPVIVRHSSRNRSIIIKYVL